MALETGISLNRDPTGEPRGEVHLPETTRDSKRGLWKQGVSLSMKALQRKLGGRAPSLGGLEDYVMSNERIW